MPPATMRSSRGSAPTSTRSTWARTASIARRRELPFAQTAQILPLAFGLVPEAQRRPLLLRLVDDITNARGGHEYVGVLGARYILPVLLQGGDADVALRIATQTDYPSYGYWLSLGWTSLGEFWEDTSRSRSHHFFGSIVQSFYEDLAGIRPLEPGFREDRGQAGGPGGARPRVGHVRQRARQGRGRLAPDALRPPARRDRPATCHGGRPRPRVESAAASAREAARRTRPTACGSRRWSMAAPCTRSAPASTTSLREALRGLTRMNRTTVALGFALCATTASAAAPEVSRLAGRRPGRGLDAARDGVAAPGREGKLVRNVVGRP